MTALLRLSGREKVLEVGTGSGYQAAVLAAAARRGVHDRAAAAPGRARAATLEDARILATCGCARRNGTLGWPDEAPFDRILVAAGGPARAAAAVRAARRGRAHGDAGGGRHEPGAASSSRRCGARCARASIPRCMFVQARGKVRVGALMMHGVPGYEDGDGRRGVAQLGSAPASGAGGRWFKSSRPDHFSRSETSRRLRATAAADASAGEMTRDGSELAAPPRSSCEGRVQGVGYRNFVQRKAGQLGLAGYVMNLKDGRVRVRVEGSRRPHRGAGARPGEGPAAVARRQTVAVTWRPATGRFRPSRSATRSSTSDVAPAGPGASSASASCCRASC